MYQRLDDFKQLTFILPQSWRPKVCNNLSEDSREEPCWGFPRILGGLGLRQQAASLQLLSVSNC